MRRFPTPDTTGTRFFARAPFARFHVEYPEAYDSRFPLDRVPAGREVALGVVDARSPRPETRDRGRSPGSTRRPGSSHPRALLLGNEL
ncbi:hypothetical protein [Actinoallomurus iriomotensis]|uniref:Uncharacterized protein n=1 Tax=Actinoallomurus iriomotensis TaxID=478107 RepID=A0A9W6SC90_9ACTN|nr:hypothetical protein [Actinoallomurus iriomotensis]GLY92231.1 hypothetical protein Airi02_101590 [Actinoallomurus iriomotensis]